MPIHIYHGDNTILSRNARQAKIAEYRGQGFAPTEVAGESVTRAELENVLATVNMFETDVVVIDGLVGRLRSKAKDALIELLVKIPPTKPIIMWEKKLLTALMLKPFTGLAKIELFKETPTIFPFVDSLKPGNAARALTLFHACTKDNDPFMVFGMIVRRITDLMIALDDPSLVTGSPWGIKQIISQAQSWDIPRLLALHTKLLEIDINIKTGQTKLDLESQLDLLLLQL